jgi:hypothetical protein
MDELTQRYSGLTQGRRLRDAFAFARDIYRYRKLSELLSFVVWELRHRLRMFPRSQYVQMKNLSPLTMAGERLDDSGFEARLRGSFESRGLSIRGCRHNWKVLFIQGDGTIFGCTYPEDTDLYKSVDNGESIVFVKRFPQSIKSLFTSSDKTLFVCVKGAVYRSPDGGVSFTRVLELGAPVSYFRHNNSMTETPSGTLIIAEYGNAWTEEGWEKLAYLYFSADDGRTWTSSDFLIQGGTNKHVHLVRYSRLFDKVFMADGDNYKKLWVTDALTDEDLRNVDRWKPVTKVHIQTGGYTAVVETEERILFGTDYQGGTNFIVESADGERFTKRVMPDPYRRSPIINMVQRQSGRGTEIWAYLPYSAGRSKCLLMYSDDGGDSWDKVIEYEKATHKIWLINSSHHVADVLYFSIEDMETGDRRVYEVRDPSP